MDPSTDSTLHSKLLPVLQSMIRASERYIEQRFSRWDRVDEHLRIYVNPTRQARAGDWSNIKDQKENPWSRMIMIPLSYSSLMSRMVISYQTFMQADPFLHFENVEGEDLEGARMVEAAAQFDGRMSRNPLQVWQMLYDADRYGITCWHDTWEEKYMWQEKGPRLPIPPEMAGRLPEEYRKLTEPSEEFSLACEWNNWRSIDPRTLLLDPTVPTADHQKGTRMGHWEIMNWLTLQEQQFVNNHGPYFNVARARRIGASEYAQRNQGQNQVTGQFGQRTTESDYRYPDLKVYNLFWKLIPREWGLSPKEYPEIWHFAVCNRELIIRAHPLLYPHGQFPYSVGVPDLDLHSAFVPGMGEHLTGLQDVTTWLVNAHIVNTRKILHDRMIVNDELVRIDDFLSADAGQQVRLTKEGKRLHKRGMDINKMYGQLIVSDITKGHLDSAEVLLRWAQRMAATPDTIQSMPLPTKRTLGEIEQVTGIGTARIATPAGLLDEMVVKTMAERLVANRQKFTSIEQYYRLDGRLAQELEAKNMLINRDMLAGKYDYIPRTPTMPQDPSRKAQTWLMLWEMIAGNPQLMMPDPMTGKAIDPFAVFEEMVQAQGVNYIENFYRELPPPPTEEELALAGATGDLPPGEMADVGVVPDDELEAEVDAGNVVPIGGGIPGLQYG